MKDLNHIVSLIVKSFPPIHNAGYIFIFISALATMVFFSFSHFLGTVALIITAWVIYFFRNPVRIVPQGKGLVVSPADGIVSLIDENISAPEELGLADEKFNRVSVFLNVFDVHVNRIPINGKVARLNYRAGKFLSADMDKASSDNERQSVVITTEDNKTIICVQIAGLVARRILCELQEDQVVATGDLYGLIRFGSRVDIYLPNDIQPQVIVGQRMLGGETIIADLSANLVRKTGVAK